MAAGRGELGVFLQDRWRSIVVLSRSGELAVALREHVEPSAALVRDARPDECAAVLTACRPWPWMAVSDLEAMPAALTALLRDRPVLVTWLGDPGFGLPAHAQQVTSFAGLVRGVRAALAASVGPLRLAAGSGLDVVGSAQHVLSAPLEALVSAHPAGFALPVRSFRSAARALDRLGVGLRPARDSVSGHVVLSPAIGAGA